MDQDTIMISLPFRRFRKVLPILIAVSLALAGGYMIAYATKWGPWVGSDSVEYVEAARNLAAGEGLVLIRASGRVVPLYLRPPLYSMVLAGLMSLGLDAIEAGRFLAISLFFSLILLSTLLSQQAEDNYALALGIAAYILALPNIVRASTGLMSESLFMLLSLLAIILAVGSLIYHKQSLLIAAAVLAGLAWLTRFAGASSILVIALLPLLETNIGIMRRIVRSISALLIGALPFAVWTLSVRISGSAPGVYAFPDGNLWNALLPVRVAYADMLWEWLPFRLIISIDTYRSRVVILVLLFAILTLVLARIFLRRKRHSDIIDSRAFIPTTGLLFLLFSAAHALVVAIGFLIVEHPKPVLDQRVLLPSQITFFIGLVFILYSSVMHLRIPIIRLVLPMALILPSVWTGWSTTLEYVQQLNEEGAGYTSKAWLQSPIVDLVKKLSPSLAIWSSDPDAVAFFAQRPAFQIPELENGLLPSALFLFREAPQTEPEILFAQGRAVVVLFSEGHYKLSKLYEEDADDKLRIFVGSLEVLYEAVDGGIYLSPNP